MVTPCFYPGSKNLAWEYFKKVRKTLENTPYDNKVHAVHNIQGKFLFVLHIVTLLKKESITSCIASTSVRDARQIVEKRILISSLFIFEGIK